MFTWWVVMFDYIFRQKIDSSLFVASCKKPAKYIGNLASRDTFLRAPFPRFSRVVTFKLSDRYMSQTMSILEQPFSPVNDYSVTVFTKRFCVVERQGGCTIAAPSNTFA